MTKAGRLTQACQWAVAAAALLGVAQGSALAQGRDVVGTWLTESGSQVRIAPCGAARCGTIVAAKDGARDANNPDPALRNRSVVGLRMMSNAVQSGDTWTGSLYNPLDGRTYTGKMRPVGARQLELSGCILGGLICKSQTWTRAD